MPGLLAGHRAPARGLAALPVHSTTSITPTFPRGSPRHPAASPLPHGRRWLRGEVSLALVAGIGWLGKAPLFIFHPEHFVRVGGESFFFFFLFF